MRKNGAQTLLMGGQACVFYGAAEFSRDLDLLIPVNADNLNRVRAGLADLLADPIAVPVTEPPLNPELLARGHAFHFRCHRPDVEGLRIDLMARLRNGSRFDELSRALKAEEEEARERDRAYWEPLKRELEQFRHERRAQS